jgi:hypothetical protein
MMGLSVTQRVVMSGFAQHFRPWRRPAGPSDRTTPLEALRPDG